MQWLLFALKVVPLIVSAVHSIEGLRDGKKGRAKEDAAVALVKDALAMAEGGLDRDLLDDDKVEKAVRQIIKSVVALENVIADAKKKRAA